MTATLDTAAPYAPPDGIQPFLRTIAATHLAELLAPCATCLGRRKVHVLNREPFSAWKEPLPPIKRSPVVEVDCPDCDKPRRHDDGPRLVLADWLEEQGDPQGEFIRVGVEMANHRPEKIGWSFLADGTSSDAESRAINDENPVLERLQRRHDELLDRHGAAWARAVLGEVWPDKDYLVSESSVVLRKCVTSLSVTAHVATIGWHGGLPTDFTLSLDAWMGERCDLCAGSGKLQVYRSDGPGLFRRDLVVPCDQGCAGTGRVNALAPKLLAAAPVRAEGLRFRDKRPDLTVEIFWWNRYLDHRLNDPRHVPSELFDLLGGEAESWGRGDSMAGKAYPTEAAAHDALARAAIKWATQQHKEATSR